MKNLLLTLFATFLSLQAICQLVSVSAGKLDARLAPNDEYFHSMPYWHTEKTGWFSLKYDGMRDSAKYILEFRVKHKKGDFSVDTGSQAASAGESIEYDFWRMDLEFRRKIRLFYPKFLFAEIGIFSGFMPHSKAVGNSHFYLPPPYNINEYKEINGSAKKYVRNFDIGFSCVIGAQYMFNKYLGITSHVFLDQGLLKAWNGQICPSREWGAGIGLRLFLPQG
jgi:hypothetical protein